ncbi:MAG: hypothetical protein F6K09_07015 [Merismopedia sp. SIO2A8]|nr:hypothetical protein [Merismopedia sp. SIO2A8]
MGQTQTQHTFISLEWGHGLEAKDVVTLGGNSPEMIYRHWAILVQS